MSDTEDAEWEIAIPAHQFALATSLKGHDPRRPFLNSIKLDPQGNKVIGCNRHALGVFRAPEDATFPPEAILVRCDDTHFLKRCLTPPGQGMALWVCALAHDWANDTTVKLYLIRCVEGRLPLVPEDFKDFGPDLITATLAVLVDGPYPDWEATVPESAMKAAPGLMFDTDQLALFGTISGFSMGLSRGPVRLWCVEDTEAAPDTGNAVFKAVVETHDEDFIGVITQAAGCEPADDFVTPSWVYV